MIKILFVCLGNICRSPMAEFVLRDMVKRRNMQDNFYISSAGTSSEEVRKWCTLWYNKKTKRSWNTYY